MKKQLMLIASAVVLCATLIGCGSSKNDPKEIATAFVQSVTTETNITNVLAYCSESSEELMSGIKEMMGGVSELRKENKKFIFEFDVMSNKANLGDKALTEADVAFCTYMEEEGAKSFGPELLIKTKKIDGDWKVCAMQIREAEIYRFARQARSLFVALTQANTERESAGLASAWPKSDVNKSADKDDIAGKVFNTSAEYFVELFQSKFHGEADWSPYVSGVDLEVLAGAGVPKAEGTNLTGDNIAWYIAKGVTDEMDDCVPVMISRNVNIDQFPTAAGEHDMSANKAQVKLGKVNGAESDLPFGDKAFVVVSKNGYVQIICAGKDATLNSIYKNQKITLPKGFGYLKTGCKN